MRLPLLKKTSSLPIRRPRLPVVSVPRERVVFSYHASRLSGADGAARGAEPAARLRRDTHVTWKHRLYVLTLVGLTSFLVVSFLCLSAPVKVETISEGGGQIFLRDTKVYQADAQKLFEGFVAGNKVTVNTSAIASKLQADFPELKTVSVSLPVLGHQPVVYIQPVMPQLILIASDNTQYIVDSSGTALINANQVPHPEKLGVLTVHDQTGINPEVGTLVLPRTTVGFLVQVAAQLKAKQLSIDDATLLLGGSELHIKMSGSAYYAKFNIHGDAREQAGALIAVKQKLDGDHKAPKEYIDVRVEGKVYYK